VNQWFQMFPFSENVWGRGLGKCSVRRTQGFSHWAPGDKVGVGTKVGFKGSENCASSVFIQ
jgi:hypothetical protein